MNGYIGGGASTLSSTAGLPTTTSAARAALARVASGRGYMTRQGRTAYVRPAGRRGWVVEAPRDYSAHAPAYIGIGEARTFLAAARIALDYARTDPMGPHYACALDDGSADVVALSRLQHPAPGWSAEYLDNVDTWRVTLPYGAVRYYTRTTVAPPVWREDGARRYRPTYTLNRGGIQVSTRRVVTPGEPDRVVVTLVNRQGRAIRTRWFVA